MYDARTNAQADESAKQKMTLISDLLTIRKSKERKIKSKIAEIEQKIREVKVKQDQCYARLKKINKKRIALLNFTGLLTPEKFAKHKHRVHKLYIQESEEKAKIEGFEEEEKKLLADLQDHKTMLMQNMKDQEKFKYLLSEM